MSRFVSRRAFTRALPRISHVFGLAVDRDLITIAGYTYDLVDLPRSPVTLDDLRNLQASVPWSDADRDALRRAGEILIPQTDAILDVWYGFVGSTPHLVSAFAGADGQPDGEYLARVRARFGQWIADLTTRDFDEQWLAYQEEIGRRHTPIAKGSTAIVSRSFTRWA